MHGKQWKKLGVFAFLDTGAPSPHQKDYVTLVIVHGRGLKADFFARLLPLAGKLGARVVAINRRDYPGSTPFSEEDRALLLSTIPDTPAASENTDHYMKARAGELYDFLTQLVKTEELPTNSIVMAGWSLGTSFVLSFLAHAPSFDSDSWGLSPYVRRVIAYGYYAHGDTLETLSLRDALDEPSPTILRMSPEDLASVVHEPPTSLDGPDTVVLDSGLDHGALSRLREVALFAPQNAEIAWPNVEFRYVWCDRSVWVMPWGAWLFSAEIEQAMKDGKRIRKHSVVRMRGANHCAHWDEPERLLRLLLSDAPSDIGAQDVAKL